MERLDNIADENLAGTLDIFKEMDIVERNLYGQIIQQRIHIIRTLEEKVDKNAREKAIQSFIFDRLWLLDPAWERVEGTEYMERQVGKLFQDVDAELTDEEKKGRLDIGYRRTAGQHVIVELKRPERVVSLHETIKQIEKYTSGMLKLLARQNSSERVEFVLVLGEEPREWANPGGKDRMNEALRPYNARIVFYESLLENAYKMYQDYLKKREVVDRLSEVIHAINDYAPPEENLDRARD